ncbi:glycosyltransferase family 34 protein [Patellaria atrata CBS 101060]|uniref:Glycosyltransferase family 34 protein n=1 Tax=Patellaria atrata CBS 101060 TaxID=1346257 RepID=A0A9P4SBR7_9PEZI|nr:glycosyltransferase family 34 protein [Patellaria atrata CBS 101060]
MWQSRRTGKNMRRSTTFFPNENDYPIEKTTPKSWARIPAIRHAMTLYPYTTYFFYLDYRALIMNPELSIEEHIMDTKRLEDLMITDVPVVPPDSVIKTFSHLKGDRIDFVITQDKEGLVHNSFIIRRGEWAKYFLDAWFDPLYRSYNFQKGEQHALEHIVQWHGTILAKLALIPQRTMASLYKDHSGKNVGATYKEGDFVISFEGCDKEKTSSCEHEMAPFFKALESQSETGG